jgi:TIR domain
MAHDVFISYSSKDMPAGEAVGAALERHGLRCWIAPRDIVPGIGWAKSIVRAIGQSRTMVLVLSEHANSSPQIEREVERQSIRAFPSFHSALKRCRQARPLPEAVQALLGTHPAETRAAEAVAVQGPVAIFAGVEGTERNLIVIVRSQRRHRRGAALGGNRLVARAALTGSPVRLAGR